MDSEDFTPRQIEARRMGKLLRRAMMGFRGRLDDELKGHHVTTAQLRLLYEVREHPGGSGAQMARALFVSPQSAQAMLARAVERGWIARGKDPENERLVTVRLTPAGTRLLQHAEAVARTIEAEVWAGVSIQDLRFVSGILERGLHNLEKEPLPTFSTSGKSKIRPRI